MSPTASLSSSVDPAEYRITPSRSSSPSRDGVLTSFFKSKSVETPYYEYKLALNVNSSTFGLVKQNGFTLIFQVKSMPMQHMLTLHVFVRSPHTSHVATDRGYRGGMTTMTVLLQSTQQTKRTAYVNHVFVCSSICHIVYPVFPMRGCVLSSSTFFSTESGVNQTRIRHMNARTKSYSARSDLLFEVYPRPPAGVAIFYLRSLGTVPCSGRTP